MAQSEPKVQKAVTFLKPKGLSKRGKRTWRNRSVPEDMGVSLPAGYGGDKLRIREYERTLIVCKLKITSRVAPEQGDDPGHKDSVRLNPVNGMSAEISVN